MRTGLYFQALSLTLVCLSQQAFNATAVVRHMRRLQLGTSQEGQSQVSPHSPCSEHLLLPEGTEEEEDEQSGQFPKNSPSNSVRWKKNHIDLPKYSQSAKMMSMCFFSFTLARLTS